jgi:hypothetical protein
MGKSTIKQKPEELQSHVAAGQLGAPGWSWAERSGENDRVF